MLMKWPSSVVEESFIQTRKTIIQYIIAMLLQSKLADSNEQARLKFNYDFNHEDIMKEVVRSFVVVLIRAIAIVINITITKVKSIVISICDAGSPIAIIIEPNFLFTKISLKKIKPALL